MPIEKIADKRPREACFICAHAVVNKQARSTQMFFNLGINLAGRCKSQVLCEFKCVLEVEQIISKNGSFPSV